MSSLVLPALWTGAICRRLSQLYESMNPYAIYAKLGIALALIAAIFLAGYRVGGLRSKAALEALQASQFHALALAYQQQQLDAEKKRAALERENETLSDVALKYPDVAVRVCHIAAAPAVPQAARDGQVVPPGTGVLPKAPVPSPDLGPVLFADADKADEIIAKCRAL